ncbi:MAG: NAD(P)H-binding protein, partial [Solirubrobacterales bacterium]|nr:NAD(P)H-binding protein [Solirubrobacterales bacterium]
MMPDESLRLASHPSDVDQKTVLLTGATGYVGGRLLHRLEAEARYRVRCLTRHPGALAGRIGAGTDLVAGDVLEPRSLAAAMRGVH